MPTYSCWLLQLNSPCLHFHELADGFGFGHAFQCCQSAKCVAIFVADVLAMECVEIVELDNEADEVTWSVLCAASV